MPRHSRQLWSIVIVPDFVSDRELSAVLRLAFSILPSPSVASRRRIGSIALRLQILVLPNTIKFVQVVELHVCGAIWMGSFAPGTSRRNILSVFVRFFVRQSLTA